MHMLVASLQEHYSELQKKSSELEEALYNLDRKLKRLSSGSSWRDFTGLFASISKITGILKEYYTPISLYRKNTVKSGNNL